MIRPLANCMLGLGFLIATTHANAQTTVPKATIFCPISDTPGEIRWAHGELQFPEGFAFYGPSRKKIEGSFVIKTAHGTSSLQVTLAGHYIKGEHFASPNYWLLSGISEDGKEIRFYLEQQSRSQDFAFGEVQLGNELPLNAKCSIKLILPELTRPPRCHPRAPC